MSKHHDRNFGLDLARFLAIGGVIISHFSRPLEPFGFWGVELFFALSGYLIGNILWRSFAAAENWGFSSILNFWQRRWWRTLPGYYLFLVITMVVQYCLYKYTLSVPQIATSVWFGQYIVNPPIDFYGVSWSLCIEEWFYLLFPVCLLVFNKFIKKQKSAFMATILFFLIASIVVRAIVAGTGINTFPIRKLTFCRLDAIAFGVGVAFLSSIFTITYRIRLIAFFAGLACLMPAFIMVHFLSVSYVQAIPIQFLAIITPLSFALLLPMAGTLVKPGAKFSVINTCVTKISLWSYSIYLSHIVVLFTVYIVMDSSRGSVAINVLSKFIALAVTVLVSAFLYKFFEWPLTQKRPAELRSKKTLAQKAGT